MIRPRICLLFILTVLALHHLMTPSDGRHSKEPVLEIPVEFLDSVGTEGGPEVQECERYVKEHLVTEPMLLDDDDDKVFIPSPIKGYSSFSQMISADHRLLGELLFQVIERDLTECDLVIAFDESYKDAEALDWILLLQNVVQILHLKTSNDFDPVIWTSSHCQGYLFLANDAQSLLSFANEDLDSWDYSGKFVFAGMSLADLSLLMTSKKGRKTEKILGIAKDMNNRSERWNLYTNLLFGDTAIKRICSWKNGAFSSDAILFPDKTKNFQGAKLTATTFMWEPDVLYERDNNGSVLSMYGIDIDVVTTLADVLNFTLVYQEPPNGEMWGDVDENGSWAGMMGILQRDETDIAFSLYVSDIFLDILDYTIPYKFEMSCFIVQQEPPLPRWQAFLYPFQPLTWISIFIGLLITAPLLVLFSMASRKLIGSDIGEIQSWGRGLSYAFGIYLARPNANLPRNTTNQIYILFLWLYCIILGIAYSSNLTAFMAVKKVPRKLETISDLRKSGQVVVGIDRFYKDMFEASLDPNLHHLSKTYSVIEDIGEIFSLLREGGYVYQGNEGYLAYTIASNFTSKGGVQEMRIMKECFTSHSLALGLQNHSPLKGAFDNVLRGMTSGGLVKRYLVSTLRTAAISRELQLKETDPLLENSPTDVPLEFNEALGLDHLQGVFFVTLIGWLLALFTFCMELLIHKLIPE